MPIAEIYVPLYVGFPRDPKVRRVVVNNGLTGMAAAHLSVAMTCYCRENLSDGYVPVAELSALCIPLRMRDALRLASLLTSENLLEAVNVSQSDTPSAAPAPAARIPKRHSRSVLDHLPEDAPVGWIVRAYVKRNGTREDVERRSDLARSAAHVRWTASAPQSGPDAERNANGNADRNAPGTADRSADRSANGNAKSESESEVASSSVVDGGARGGGQAHARARARDDEDDHSNHSNTRENLASLVVALMASAGVPCTADQAPGVLDRITGGRRLADPAAYVRRALRSQAEARQYAPGAPPRRPRHAAPLDPAYAARAAELRAREAGQVPLDADEREHRAHEGADVARKALANRDRAEVPAVVTAGELHGEALARSQLAASRVQRALPPPLPETPDVDDDYGYRDDDAGRNDDDPDEDPEEYDDEPPF